MIIGQGPPPRWVPAPAARVQRTRTLLALTGLPVIGAALVFGIVLVAVGLTLPSARSPINVIGVMMGGVGAFWALLSGVSLTTARSCARDGYVDVAGARVVRRLLGVWWGGAVFCALLAGLVELKAPQPSSTGSAVYLAVLALLVVPGGLAFFVARSALRTT